MDILLLIILMVLCLSFMILITYFNEKKSIIYSYIMCNIVNYILSFKVINVLGLNINANVITSVIFILMTYLVIEKTNIKEFKKIIFKVLCVNVIISIFIFISSLYIGSVTDSSTIDIRNVFLSNYKILLSYPFVTMITELLTFIIYKNTYEDNINSNIKIVLTNLNVVMCDTFLFNIFGYIFSVSYREIILLIITNYLIKVLFTTLFSPLVTYLLDKKVNV